MTDAQLLKLMRKNKGRDGQGTGGETGLEEEKAGKHRISFLLRPVDGSIGCAVSI